MSDHTIWFVMAFGIIAALVCEFAVYRYFQRKALEDEDFDGGYSIENEIRITRIKAPFIISKGDTNQ